MRIKCDRCNGSGRVKLSRKCPACRGLGSTKMTLDGNVKKNKCPKCNGKGKVTVEEECRVCHGSGNIYLCDLCDRPTNPRNRLCPSCYSNPIVFELKPPVAEEHIMPYRAYLGRVTKITDNHVFIDLGDDYYGSAPRPPKNVPDLGAEVIAKLMGQTGPKRFNLYMISPSEYNVQTLQAERERDFIQDVLAKESGESVFIHGQVVKIIHTSGPTIFTVLDESGSQIDCITYDSPSTPDYDDIEENDVVTIYGELSLHRNNLQIQIEEMNKASQDTADKLLEKIENLLLEKATETLKAPFLIENEILNQLRDKIEDVAKRIRKAIFEGQSVLIRHHADADGVIGGIALEEAINSLIESEDMGGDTSRNFIRRYMNRSPFYNMSDCSRDLEYSLELKNRQNMDLPLNIIVDFGSSLESKDSFELLNTYGIETIVIDHHPLDQEMNEIVAHLVNPHNVTGGDYNLTAGIIATEIARLIQPDITDDIKHLPAVAAIGDNIDSEGINQYQDIVDEKYQDKIEDMAFAIDYECFHLRYSDGKELFRNILDLNKIDEVENNNVRTLLAEKARESYSKSVDIGLKNIQIEEDTDNVLFARLDINKYTHKYDFPPSRKIIGSIHDHLVEENPDKKVITLAESRNRFILRSKDLDINFPEIVKKLQEEIPAAGVNGGGHEFVGSLSFFEGKREQVTDLFLKELKQAVQE